MYLQKFCGRPVSKSPNIFLSREILIFSPRRVGAFSPRAYDFTAHLARTSAISDLRATTPARRSPVASEGVTVAICNHRYSRASTRESSSVQVPRDRGRARKRVVVLLVAVNSCRASYRFDHASMLIAARRPLAAADEEREMRSERRGEKNWPGDTKKGGRRQSKEEEDTVAYKNNSLRIM